MSIESDIHYMMTHWGYTRERACEGIQNGEQADIIAEKNERALDSYLSDLEEGSE